MDEVTNGLILLVYSRELEKKLLHMSFQLLHHQQNYSVGIFQMVNFIFGAYYPSVKLLVFFITDEFSERPAIINKVFLQWPVSVCKFIGKILTDNILKLILTGYSVDKSGSIQRTN